MVGGKSPELSYFRQGMRRTGSRTWNVPTGKAVLV
jgi:hypothetical protein